MNKTAKHRLSQAEIDSLVQQAAVKKQLGSGSGLPMPRTQKPEAKPNADSRRQPEVAPSSSNSAAGKPVQADSRRQTSGGTQEQLREQQTNGAPDVKPEETQSAPKPAESSAKAEASTSQDEGRGEVSVLSPLPQQSHLELEQRFSLGGEGTSGIQSERVMIVLDRKLFKLG